MAIAAANPVQAPAINATANTTGAQGPALASGPALTNFASLLAALLGPNSPVTTGAAAFATALAVTTNANVAVAATTAAVATADAAATTATAITANTATVTAAQTQLAGNAFQVVQQQNTDEAIQQQVVQQENLNATTTAQQAQAAANANTVLTNIITAERNAAARIAAQTTQTVAQERPPTTNRAGQPQQNGPTAAGTGGPFLNAGLTLLISGFNRANLPAATPATTTPIPTQSNNTTSNLANANGSLESVPILPSLVAPPDTANTQARSLPGPDSVQGVIMNNEPLQAGQQGVPPMNFNLAQGAAHAAQGQGLSFIQIAAASGVPATANAETVAAKTGPLGSVNQQSTAPAPPAANATGIATTVSAANQQATLAVPPPAVLTASSANGVNGPVSAGLPQTAVPGTQGVNGLQASGNASGNSASANQSGTNGPFIANGNGAQTVNNGTRIADGTASVNANNQSESTNQLTNGLTLNPENGRIAIGTTQGGAAQSSSAVSNTSTLNAVAGQSASTNGANFDSAAIAVKLPEAAIRSGIIGAGDLPTNGSSNVSSSLVTAQTLLTPQAVTANLPQTPAVHAAGDISEQVANGIVSNAQLVTRGGQSEFQIRLDPPELGPIQIRLTSTADGLSAQIAAANPGTRQMIESQLPDLMQRLQNSGLSLGNFNVSADAGSGGGSQPQQQPVALPPIDNTDAIVAAQTTQDRLPQSRVTPLGSLDVTA